jgi:hypothetical protein
MSCNQNTLFTDFEIFFSTSSTLRNTNRFLLDDFQAYPITKTNYVFSTSLIKIDPIALVNNNGSDDNTGSDNNNNGSDNGNGSDNVCHFYSSPILLLPVGLPGSGKSSFCRYIKMKFFEIGLAVKIIERDVIFSKIRGNNETSLKKTKQETHNTLLEELINGYDYSQSDMEPSLEYLVNTSMDNIKLSNHFISIICLDSTNGSKEARDLYTCSSQSYYTFIITFTMKDIDILYDRCHERKNHPAFPSTESEGRLKISNVLKGMDWPLTTSTGQLTTVQSTNTIQITLNLNNIEDWDRITLKLFFASICSYSLFTKIYHNES